MGLLLIGNYYFANLQWHNLQQFTKLCEQTYNYKIDMAMHAVVFQRKKQLQRLMSALLDC